MRVKLLSKAVMLSWCSSTAAFISGYMVGSDMEKFFNTSGPVKADKHYSLDPLTRVDWDEIKNLIDNERYFVLHAPRQTGKTSALLAMMKALNDSGDYARVIIVWFCLLINTGFCHE
jgi:hypothetical protein